MSRTPTALALLAALGAAAPASAQTTEQLLARAEKTVSDLEGRLLVVEKLYARENEQSELEGLMQRFSDAEIQYLLGEYNNAAVLLYDLVEERRFRESGKLGDAYFYLAEALFQQRNFLGSRRYFKEILERREGRYVRQALKRYLEVSAKLNDFSGMDDYFRLAKEASATGERPELSYVFAKWSFRRTDLPREERLRRSEEQFQALVAGGGYAVQATYFLGVIAVEKGDLKTAAEKFEAVTKLASGARGDPALAELGQLSLGRVYYEQGKFDEAIDRYTRIAQDSPSFNEALYEIAWTYVKKGAYKEALRATDLLLLTAEETTLAPEAKILQGHLLLRVGKYGEARETYEGVINVYAPIRDEIDALLTTHADPIAYFNELLKQNADTLDVTQLLPPVAVKWATTEREVGNALRVVKDLDESRKGIDESRAIATRLLENLGQGRGLEASPTLAEGMAKAEAAEAEALAAERFLLQAEAALIGDRLGAATKAELDRVRAERQQLEAKFAALPKTPEAVDARKARMLERVDEIDRTLYRLGYQVESLAAQTRAIQKWLADTKDTRNSDAEGEATFAEALKREELAAAELRKEYGELRKQLLDEKAAIGGGGGGAAEAELRRRYEELLGREQAITREARAGAAAPLLGRVDRVRGQLHEVKARVQASKVKIRALADRRAAEIRKAVLAEAGLLDQYEGETAGVTTDARDLVGRIAFESFKRVRKSFYTLVLKADVGLIDVAWTRKRDKSSQIQKLSQEKDRDLKELDEEYRDVLEEEP